MTTSIPLHGWLGERSQPPRPRHFCIMPQLPPDCKSEIQKRAEKNHKGIAFSFSMPYNRRNARIFTRPAAACTADETQLSLTCGHFRPPPERAHCAAGCPWQHPAESGGILCPSWQYPVSLPGGIPYPSAPLCRPPSTRTGNAVGTLIEHDVNQRFPKRRESKREGGPL